MNREKINQAPALQSSQEIHLWNRGTRDLEIHNSDREDFFEISVWELVDIINAAYELGQKNILKTLDKK